MIWWKFLRFNAMEPIFDYAKFSFRSHLKLREVAEKTGASTSLVGNWNSGKAVPSYEKIAKLIEIGMTAQELFGEELGNLLVKNSATEAKPIDKEQVMSAVREALRDLSNGQ